MQGHTGAALGNRVSSQGLREELVEGWGTSWFLGDDVIGLLFLYLTNFHLVPIVFWAQC